MVYTGFRRLDGSVNQAFPTAHSMKIHFLWRQALVEILKRQLLVFETLGYYCMRP